MPPFRPSADPSRGASDRKGDTRPLLGKSRALGDRLARFLPVMWESTTPLLNGAKNAKALSSRVVHQLHRRKLGRRLLSRRLALGWQVFCRHGACPGARLLRLRHLRGQAAGARGVSWLDRDHAEIRPAGAQARSCPTRHDGRRRDLASRRSPDNVDPGLAALYAGPRLGDYRPYFRRSFWLEHRDQRRGSRGAEFRHGCLAAARYAIRDGRRIHGRGQSALRLVGARCGRQGSRARRLRRPHKGPPDPLQGRVLQGPRSAQHRAVAARPGRLMCRPAARRAGATLPPNTPTRSSRPPTRSAA